MLRRETGAGAAEFALLLPIMVALLIGVIDVGRMAWTKMEVQAAARAGANYALVNAAQSFAPVEIKAAVASATGLAVTPGEPVKETGCLDASGATVQPCGGSLVSGDYVSVPVSATYTPIWFDPVTLSATAKVRIS
ncbi:TadE family protein [Sphingopyxis bauzanensis]|uniref:TadE family protein n=1 Tax=Sphingopyxis bauzanensis TaxID=651663 RepID=UPI0013039E05|nr:TadE/TadG family type IV pilus assembly protein [Sphingopyxis bauzanensis]